jgi:carboxyl-terminal processing protease
MVSGLEAEPMRRTAVSAAFLTALIWCAAPPAADAQISSCTPLGENLYVRDVMTDLYLWYAEMPGADPAAYDSPESYLEAVRFRPLDTTFSYITSRAESDAFFSSSQFVGFGISTAIAGNEMRIMQVFPGSPAEEAGLARGDRIIAISGRPVAQLIATGEIDTAFGATDIGVAVDVTFVDLLGTRHDAQLVKRLVTIPTVSLTRIYEQAGRKIGYIFFRNFVEPSNEALDAAFEELGAAGIHDLVLDLRYNGGGLVNVAQHLASLIGGATTRGQVFAEYFHNDKNMYRNRRLRFVAAPNALRLDRLIVITTRASASASELVINSLRPFMPVVVIGDRTYGKPVGQYQVAFCDKLLAPVSFMLRNANGEGSYFEGLPVDCPAADDPEHQLGDPEEASLREAMTYAVSGACTPRPPGVQRRIEAHAPRRVVGWRSVVNAY